mmetsp:Transcript_10283/g.30949  ORF Transcript_10283/g.30949 Transcript_10283/m.30949 type:complete len:197 (+) Transcript_10283:114-704(+)
MMVQQALCAGAQICSPPVSRPAARSPLLLHAAPVRTRPFQAIPLARLQLRGRRLQRCAAEDGEGKVADAEKSVEKAGDDIVEAGKDLLRVGLPNEDLPPWLRKEKMQALEEAEGADLPFGVFLLASTLVAIAAVGSIFEFLNKNPIFGVLPSSSPFYLPILGFFVVTGFPTAGFLFLKGVDAFNKAADRQDKMDGY